MADGGCEVVGGKLCLLYLPGPVIPSPHPVNRIEVARGCRGASLLFIFVVAAAAAALFFPLRRGTHPRERPK